jgi:high frequency lysogenization protein
LNQSHGKIKQPMSNQPSAIDRAIALAGLAQSIRIVQNVAWKGSTNPTDLKAIIASLLKIDAVSAIDVYGGSFEVSTGLRVLKHQLDTSTQDKDPEFVSLAINVLSIHKQLNNYPHLMDTLSQSMAKLSARFSDQNFYHDEDVFEQLLQQCSEIYSNTLSKLPNRIQVKGEPKYLKMEDNQIKVRAALLCAIRSTFLWRQSGGSRWQFLFKKREILSCVSDLISHPRKQ